MYIPILIGLFKDHRFAYARAALDPLSSTSIIIPRIAEELRCLEPLDRSYTIHHPLMGDIIIDKICVVDKAIVEGKHVDLKTVIHVGKPQIENLEFEAIIGRDLILYWQLEVNTILRIVRLRYQRLVTQRY